MKSKNISAVHSNNFDFIRIIAALAVLYSHHFALTAQMEPSFFGLHSLGGAAVLVFFVVSGYLVTASWYNDPNIFRFAWRRALRIWPALTLVVACTAFILGPIVTSLPLQDYFTHRATYDYFHILRMNIVFVLPGVFENNPYPLGVNGSLWTIPLEVRCYIVLAALGLFGLLKNKYIFLGSIVAYMIWFTLKSSADIYQKIHYAREFSAFFLAGAGLFALKEHWQKKPRVVLALCIIIATILWSIGWRYMAAWVFVPYAIIFFGTSNTRIINQFGRWGDPSYGIYLIAYPIQQTVIKYLWPSWGFWETMAISALITVCLAYLSWNYIEKWFLKFKPKRKK
ncbi:acyltransferase [Lampropedia aestuarii]|uniref:Acyltransferase n=1 Tax=Lampropedia aestuarii TaxID=2562762 RepID=A0A4S5BIR1_9BURK|nr:acyltransferase [Lampropedia aestuarii]THJ32039.1 acyltransferase [Lampropedia aestuarii]